MSKDALFYVTRDAGRIIGGINEKRKFWNGMPASAEEPVMLEQETITLTLEQQIEIERIVMDKDKEAALDLVKQIQDKLKSEQASHMKRMGI